MRNRLNYLAPVFSYRGALFWIFGFVLVLPLLVLGLYARAGQKEVSVWCFLLPAGIALLRSIPKKCRHLNRTRVSCRERPCRSSPWGEKIGTACEILPRSPNSGADGQSSGVNAETPPRPTPPHSRTCAITRKAFCPKEP